MGGSLQLGWALGIGLLSVLFVEDTVASKSIDCGQDISPRDVLVVDVEPLRHQPEMAQEYVDERAGDFRLLNSGIQEFIMRERPSKDPRALVRGAKKLGAKKGCDLVLVLKTGPYFGRQRSPKARIKDHGYAWVVMGQRLTDH